MRQFVALTALAVVVFTVGCQSCSNYPAPVVGDSMSHWGAAPPSCAAPPPSIDFRGALAGLIHGRNAGGPVCGGQHKYDDFGCNACNPSGGPICETAACGGSHGMPCGCSGSGGTCGAGTRMASAPAVMGAGMYPTTAAMGAPSLPGCGGQSCAGVCGGRCGIAQQMAAHAARHAMAMRHPAMANLLENAHRRCAYGDCGARPGPEQGAVSFPYYSVRGPRDFLAANPPSIGP